MNFDSKFKLFMLEIKELEESNQALQRKLIHANIDQEKLRKDLKEFDVLRKIAIKELEKKIAFLRKEKLQKEEENAILHMQLKQVRAERNKFERKN